MSGKSDKRATGFSEPLSPDEVFVAAICDNDPQTAAQLLRKLERLGRYALDALADMIEGAITASPRQLQRQPVALKIVSGKGRGRPRKGEVRSAVSRPGRLRKLPGKSPGWDYMMARRVQRLINSGLTREQAIQEARQYFPFARAGQKKPTPWSFSAVAKAYDRYREQLRSQSPKQTPRVLK